MLTASDIVAKVSVFIVKRATGKLISLPFDKRKKACRCLTKLYFCVQSLDEITDLILGNFDGISSPESVTDLIYTLHSNSYAIERCTNMFIDLSYELDEGLKIIDPALAHCCTILYWGKADFLSYMSNFIEFVRSDSKPFIILKRPQGRFDLVDLEQTYQLTRKALDTEGKIEWPTSPFSGYKEEFEDIRIDFEDESVATELHEMIVTQNQHLKTAKELLRILIKDSFSIEEVLFLSDSHPYR